MWSAVAGGEAHRLSGLAEQFALVSDSLKRLYPSGEVLAVAGGSHPVAQIQLDWTLGELAIHPIPYVAGQLTQGFHQPVYGVSRTQELPAFIGRINVFPNPTPP